MPVGQAVTFPDSLPFTGVLALTRDTSHEAAEATRPKQVPYREMVYNVIRDLGPITDEQIAHRSGLPANTARPRRIELLAAGRIRAVDKEGRTRAGRRAVRWAVESQPMHVRILESPEAALKGKEDEDGE